LNHSSFSNQQLKKKQNHLVKHQKNLEIEMGSDSEVIFWSWLILEEEIHQRIQKMRKG
jgi:hypothetical protein